MKFLVKFLVPALAAVALTSQLTFAQDTGATIPLNAEVSGNVELWHFWGSPVRRTAIRRVIAICSEQLPNVSVVETFKPFGDIWTANIAAVAAGSGMPGDRSGPAAAAARRPRRHLPEFGRVDGGRRHRRLAVLALYLESISLRGRALRDSF
jgi:multiple sugar transport system substrate-binding protein